MPGIQILMYHSISDNPRDPWAVSPIAFAEKMESLAQQQIPVIGIMEALYRLRGLRSLANAVVLTFDDAFCDFFTNALPILRAYQFPATVFVPTGLVGGTAIWDSHDKTKTLMDWDTLREINKDGITVGSHTVNHVRLPQCDDVTLQSELKHSLANLRDCLPDVVSVMAYPFGDAGRRELLATKNAGYVAGLGIHSRLGNFPWNNRYRLERVAMKTEIWG